MGRWYFSIAETRHTIHREWNDSPLRLDYAKSVLRIRPHDPLEDRLKNPF